nr:MAG TPA: hypothetical protein [Caudoviricetes sp.]
MISNITNLTNQLRVGKPALFYTHREVMAWTN